MNSREKGKRGERLWRDELRAAGFNARRGQQFSGSADSPDVICAELGWIHFEVKCVERLNIEEAMEQARIDCHLSPALSPYGGEGEGHSIKKVPVVAHKRSRRPWLVTMEAEVFFQLVKGDIDTSPHPLPGRGGEGDGASGLNSERSTSNIEHRSRDCRQGQSLSSPGSALEITPEAWAGDDQSGELKADSGKAVTGVFEDDDETEDEDDFTAAASAAAGSRQTENQY
jgi:hypothetical protein